MYLFKVSFSFFTLVVILKNKPTRISNQGIEIEDEDWYITYHSLTYHSKSLVAQLVRALH